MMKSRKFESLDAAIANLESKGKLKYWGRIGLNSEIHYYTLKVGYQEYRLYVYVDGLVEIREE